MTKTTINKAFCDLTDPRINRRLRHPLVNILTISNCAIICGCVVLNRLKPKEFSQNFMQWVNKLGNLRDVIVSIDGKNHV